MASSLRYLRVVPWTGIPEWEYVANRIFLEDEDAQKEAIMFIEVWCQRGNVPPAVESTVNLVKLKRVYASKMLDAGSTRLALSSSIVRFVNEVVDPNQKGSFALPVSHLAEKQNIPRLLVDIRHSSTHDELPSLEVLLYGADMALDWLKENYWNAQGNYEGSVKEASQKMLDRIREGLNECDGLNKTMELLICRSFNEVSHVEHAAEIQEPFLKVVSEDPMDVKVKSVIVDILSGKDETVVLILLKMALMGTLHLSLLESTVKNIKRQATLLEYIRICLYNPGEKSFTFVKLVCHHHNAVIPRDLLEFLETFCKLTIDKAPQSLDRREDDLRSLLKVSFKDCPQDWSTITEWTPVSFGVTADFDPVKNFHELIFNKS